MCKEYEYQGNIYVENGEMRYPKKGEIFYHPSNIEPTKAPFDYASIKCKILIPKGSKMENKEIEKAQADINQAQMEITSAQTRLREANERLEKAKNPPKPRLENGEIFYVDNHGRDKRIAFLIKDGNWQSMDAFGNVICTFHLTDTSYNDRIKIGNIFDDMRDKQ